MTSRWKLAVTAAAGAAIAAGAVIALSTGMTGPAGATPDTTVPDEPATDTSTRSITVTGHGTVTVVPDIANLNAGVQATAPTAVEALDTVSANSQDLVATLGGLGIAEADIQTSGLNLWPMFGSNGQEITGYQASTSVNVAVRDVEAVGPVVDGLKSFVGEELTLGGISFSYDDPEAVLDEARTAAIENARIRAEQYAAAAGTEVGDILRIIESSAARTPIPLDFAADEAARSSVAIEPGTQDLAADVTVVFAMA